MFNAFEWISTTILTAHDYTHRQCDYSELDLRIVIIYAGLVFFFIDNNAKCELPSTNGMIIILGVPIMVTQMLFRCGQRLESR